MTTSVLVRNRQPGPTVFSIDAHNFYEWAGAGDPDGADVQAVTADLLTDVRFARAVQRGVLAVEDADAEITSLLQTQADAWRRRQEQIERDALAKIEARPDNDLVQEGCLASGCKAQLMVKLKTRYDTPVLCSRHRDLASSFVLTIDPESDDGTGKPVHRWSFVPAPR